MAVLSSVQTGTVTIGNGSSSNTATITSVTVANCMLTFTYSGSNGMNDSKDAHVDGIVTDSTTLTFSRGSSTQTITIEYRLAEFSSGVTSQKGSFTDSDFSDIGDYYSADKTITAVGDEAFPMVWQQKGVDTYADTNTGSILTSSTNLQLRVGDDGAIDTTLAGKWQVLDFTSGATVTSGETTLSNGSTSTTETVSITDTSKAMLIASYYTDSGTFAASKDYCLTWEITNSTTLTFSVNSSANTHKIQWYLVEFTDDSVVRHGTLAFTGTDVTKSDTFSSLDSDNAIVILSGINYSSGSTSSSGDSGETNFARVTTLSDTGITLTRGDDFGVSLTTEYWVVELSTTPEVSFVPKVMFF